MSRLSPRVRGRATSTNACSRGAARGERRLTARSARLVDPLPVARRRALREMLDRAEHRRIFLKAQVRLREQRDHRSEAVIRRSLATSWRRSRPVSPRGVILADRLIRDGANLPSSGHPNAEHRGCA